MILFTKGGPQWLELMADTGRDAPGRDWTGGIGKARVPVSRWPGGIAANTEPSLLYAMPERIRAEVETALASYSHGAAVS